MQFFNNKLMKKMGMILQLLGWFVEWLYIFHCIDIYVTLLISFTIFFFFWETIIWIDKLKSAKIG